MNKSLKAKIRCKKYRKKILEMSQSVSALHIGGSFSSVEIVDCIYNRLKKNKFQKIYTYFNTRSCWKCRWFHF